MMMSALAAMSTAQDNPQSYSWRYRPVYIFAPTANHPDLKPQMDAFLTRRLDLKDRDIVLISVIGDKVKTHFGPHETRTAKVLRQAYNIDPNLFTVILIGKDTGVKSRHIRITPPKDIFRQIDAMPMRIDEMRQNELRAGKP